MTIGIQTNYFTRQQLQHLLHAWGKPPMVPTKTKPITLDFAEDAECQRIVLRTTTLKSTYGSALFQADFYHQTHGSIQ